MRDHRINKLMNREHLSTKESYEIFLDMMTGDFSYIQMASFLTAMALKGETKQEILGGARALRDKSVSLANLEDNALDTCGTGGDGKNTINVSTAAAFIAATAGVKIIKHGNRSASSQSGSADVLEEMDINIHLNADEAREIYKELGMVFLFAPLFHPSMKNVAPVRKELGFRTIFNLLGPLANPAQVKRQVLGVNKEGLVEIMADSLLSLGIDRAMVVHGLDGLDEISVSGQTLVCEIKNGTKQHYFIHPSDFQMTTYPLEEIIGHDTKDNKELLYSLLKGFQKGAKADFLAINAGAAIYIGGKAETLGQGIHMAQDILSSGVAYSFLEAYRLATKRYGA